jgi:RNA recognition motif-containing protein
MSKRIFVGNLPYEANANELLAWFRSNGFPAEAANISVDTISGHPRGFGFVEMNDRLAEACVSACNGQDFLGRALIVNAAQPLLERRRSASARTRD